MSLVVNTFDKSPLNVGVTEVRPADALVIWAQPVDPLLLPVVVQGEDRPTGPGQQLDLGRVKPHHQQL